MGTAAAAFGETTLACQEGWGDRLACRERSVSLGEGGARSWGPQRGFRAGTPPSQLTWGSFLRVLPRTAQEGRGQLSEVQSCQPLVFVPCPVVRTSALSADGQHLSHRSGPKGDAGTGPPVPGAQLGVRASYTHQQSTLEKGDVDRKAARTSASGSAVATQPGPNLQGAPESPKGFRAIRLLPPP